MKRGGNDYLNSPDLESPGPQDSPFHRSNIEVIVQVTPRIVLYSEFSFVRGSVFLEHVIRFLRPEVGYVVLIYLERERPLILTHVFSDITPRNTWLSKRCLSYFIHKVLSISLVCRPLLTKVNLLSLPSDLFSKCLLPLKLSSEFLIHSKTVHFVTLVTKSGFFIVPVSEVHVSHSTTLHQVKPQ